MLHSFYLYVYYVSAFSSSFIHKCRWSHPCFRNEVHIHTIIVFSLKRVTTLRLLVCFPWCPRIENKNTMSVYVVSLSWICCWQKLETLYKTLGSSTIIHGVLVKIMMIVMIQNAFCIHWKLFILILPPMKSSSSQPEVI